MKIFNLYFILSTSVLIFAQLTSVSQTKNVVSMSAGTMIPASNYCAKFKYERSLNQFVSVGLNSLLYSDFEMAKGYVGEFYLRYYPDSKELMTGFYLQPSAFLGKVEHGFLYKGEKPEDPLQDDIIDLLGSDILSLFFDVIEGKYVYITERYDIKVRGVGLNVGIQNNFGKSKFYYDLNIGAKFISKPDNIPEIIYVNGIAMEITESSIVDGAPDGYKPWDKSRVSSGISSFVGIGFSF